MSNLDPKIYVACLASYNAGNLHGVWIDANQDPESLQDEISTMLINSAVPNAEEWAIHDYDNFCGLALSECVELEKISNVAAFLVENGELGVALLKRHTHDDIEEAIRMLEECYQGKYDSESDFVREFSSEIMEIPQHLQMYIDYERMARDWFICDYFSIKVDHNVHVFIND